MNVLLVAYHYPPMGGAGVQRALKFSKYLGEFGVRTVVLAAHDPAYAQDPTLLAEIPAGVKVVRVPYRPLLQRLLDWRAKVAARRAPTGPAAPLRSSPSPAAPARSPRWRDRLLAAWATLHFPDDKAGWARRALAPGLQLLREERIDLVLSTAPPMSAHWLAARLARAGGLPWVLDYRDLWTENPAYAAPRWRRALDCRVEAGWLRRAAGVVTVTPSWRQRFEARLGGGCPVAFIPNGYDEADFAALSAAAPRGDGVFRLVHTGTFYGPRDPGTLLDGLGAYLAAAPTGAPALRLRLVGPMGSRFADRLARFEAAHPGVIERRPYVPHHAALAEMLAADALLLVVGAGAGGERAGAVVAGTLPGKIFEYLRAGRPILMLGDEQGDAAALVREHGAGWVADETRPERIAAALRSMLAAPPAGGRPRSGVERFERRALAGRLADFLRECRGRAPAQMQAPRV